MKLDKIKNQLDKINILIKSIQGGNEDISSVEKDLLLSYIRKMYELALAEKAPQKSNSKPKRKKKEPKIKEVMDIVDKPKADVPAERKEEPAEKNIEEVTPVSDTASHEVESQNPSLHIPEEVSELFTHKKAVELSEKLSEAPISDLKKAMGINEKIFTVKELFGGKQSFFNEAIQILNSFNSFEEAKDYLIKNVAVENSWGEASKKKKAGNFIKLVRRRYK